MPPAAGADVPSDEGKQVLRLLADGKIDVEQAYRLLRALGDIDERPRGPTPPTSPVPLLAPEPAMPPGGRGRILRLEDRAPHDDVRRPVPDGLARR